MAYEINTFQDLIKFVHEYQEGRKDIEIDWNKEIKKILKKAKIFYLPRLFTVLLLKILFRAYFRLKVKGAKNLPHKGSFIIVANHSSHLDFPLLFSSFPLARSNNVLAPAAADYFYKNKLRQILVECSLNTFPFERFGNFMQSLKLCKELLKRGHSLILFPEGKRSPSGEVQDFKPGVGALSCELDIPIIPVYIDGAHKALAKGNFFIKPSRITISIGSPFYPPEGEKGYALYNNIAKKVKEEILKLKDS
jgi:1-acyl-sn-glycerol-3-phosphate acyltransferase